MWLIFLFKLELDGAGVSEDAFSQHLYSSLLLRLLVCCSTVSELTSLVPNKRGNWHQV